MAYWWGAKQEIGGVDRFDEEEIAELIKDKAEVTKVVAVFPEVEFKEIRRFFFFATDKECYAFLDSFELTADEVRQITYQGHATRL